MAAKQIAYEMDAREAIRRGVKQLLLVSCPVTNGAISLERPASWTSLRPAQSCGAGPTSSPKTPFVTGQLTRRS